MFLGLTFMFFYYALGFAFPMLFEKVSQKLGSIKRARRISSNQSI